MKKAGTIYGYRRHNGDERFPDWPLSQIKELCKRFGYVMIAYDVSPTRVVSVRD